MKKSESIINIPKRLTHGEDLVVIRKSEYQALRCQFKKLKDTLDKVRRGEMELSNAKTKRIGSLRKIQLKRGNA